MGLIHDLLQFFYPELCVSCGQILGSMEKILCAGCFYHLPRTDFHTFSENPMSQLFWGRVRIEHSAAWFYYFKGSSYQSIIHKLKYNGRKDIGIEMGKAFASEILGFPVAEVDALVPVPLHPKKLSLRGFNQSEMIAAGMSSILNKQLITSVLSRSLYTDTQTRKSRFDRFKNTEGKFEIRNTSLIENKHLLLIDDVVTTGSTIESCARALLNIKGVKVSVASLAVA